MSFDLNKTAQFLWAKKSAIDEPKWLPLFVHMIDSAAIAELLWENWLTPGIKRVISHTLEYDEMKKLVMFLAASHDLGKATPVFQAKPAKPPCDELDSFIEHGITSAGLKMRHWSFFQYADKAPHALATQLILENSGCCRNIAAILGAHHGHPQSYGSLFDNRIDSYSRNYYLNHAAKDNWIAVQEELIAFACSLSDIEYMSELPDPEMPTQVILSGIMIMTDWIASNEQLFPLFRFDDFPSDYQLKNRSAYAWEQLHFTPEWHPDNDWVKQDLYDLRFQFSANNMQKAVETALRGALNPGIMVIEAPMGKGKTEAALYAAEALANGSERSGIFFALPTQATSDGIFPRICRWINNLDPSAKHTIRLAHSKAQFNDQMQALKKPMGFDYIGIDEFDGSFVHEWFEGQKKALLADFVVGTIDQLLMAALRQKHVMLRHLGLANKVVIIDECHAYDAYMNCYLERVLNWLGLYKVPVIILSATLPVQTRAAVINAYRNVSMPCFECSPADNPLWIEQKTDKKEDDWAVNRSYPLITFTDGDDVMQVTVPKDDQTLTVQFRPVDDTMLNQLLEELLSEGGCAGIIVNSVQRAQAIAEQLLVIFGEGVIQLLHSRFLAPDRIRNEQILLRELGKPSCECKRPLMRIVVGTQVLEQSLDIDFDVIVTDFAPVDLLLQRMGRLHRHSRVRPTNMSQPVCYIMGMNTDTFDKATDGVYGAYLLMRTKEVLKQLNQILLPQDIPELVQNVYGDRYTLAASDCASVKAKNDWERIISDKEKRANDFRLAKAWRGASLIGWLDNDRSEKLGEAAVRDTDESIEVLLLRETEDGRLVFWNDHINDCDLLLSETPDEQSAMMLARQRLRLPPVLCKPWMIDKTIRELEEQNGQRFYTWRKSPWLKGDLFLVMVENIGTILNGYLLTYDSFLGLIHEKEDDNK